MVFLVSIANMKRMFIFACDRFREILINDMMLVEASLIRFFMHNVKVSRVGYIFVHRVHVRKSGRLTI